MISITMFCVGIFLILVAIAYLIAYKNGYSFTEIQMIITLFLTTGGKMITNKKNQAGEFQIRKIKGVGLVWNTPLTKLFNARLGILISFCLYLVILFIVKLAKFDMENLGVQFALTNEFFWVAILICSMVFSSQKNERKSTIPAQHAGRLEVNGRGIIEKFHNEKPVYVMILEVEDLILASFANITEFAVSLREIVIKGDTTTTSKDSLQIKTTFTSNNQITEPGLVFSSIPEGDEDMEPLLTEKTKGLIVDFTQAITAETLFSITSEEIYDIFTSEEKVANKIRTTKSEKYFSFNGNFSKVEKILYDFVFPKKQLVDLRFSEELKKVMENLQNGKRLTKEPWPNGPMTLKEFEDQKTQALNELEIDFQVFLNAILEFINANEKFTDLGYTLKEIPQLEPNFANDESKKIFEKKTLQKYIIAANDLHLSWLQDRINDLKNQWKKDKITVSELIKLIQVEFGKRTAMEYDITGSKSGSTKPWLPLPTSGGTQP